MRNDKLIDDLFEAARNEPPTHSISAVEQFIQNAPTSTSGLIMKWLKQYKMNILITTSGIVITATALLFPKEEMVDQNDVSQVQEVQVTRADQVPVEEESVIENPKDVHNALQPDQEQSIQKKESEEQKEEVVTISSEEKEEEDASAPKIEVDPASLAVKTTTNTKGNDAAEKEVNSKEKFTEHKVVLVSDQGKRSVDEFSSYLTRNLSQLSHEFTSTSSKQTIKKFTLKLSNRHQADFRMTVSGFEKLELHWEASDSGEIRNVWYQLDSKGVKKLDFSKSSKFSVRVKHKHEEF